MAQYSCDYSDKCGRKAVLKITLSQMINIFTKVQALWLQRFKHSKTEYTKWVNYNVWIQH